MDYRLENVKSQVIRLGNPKGKLPSDRTAISALSQKCLDAQGIGCLAWEKEIDERVAALYGL